MNDYNEIQLTIRNYHMLFVPKGSLSYVVETTGLKKNTTARFSNFSEALFYFYHKYAVLSKHHDDVEVVDGLSVNTNPMGVKSPMAKKAGAKKPAAKKLSLKKGAKKGKK